MPYFILGVGLLLGLYFLGRWYVTAQAEDVRRVLLWAGGTVLVLVAGFLLVTGRATIAGAILFGLLPIAWRIYRTWKGLAGGGRPRPGRQSTVRTRFLDMALDHDSGALDGEVIAGQFEGRRLSELTHAELIALLDEAGGDIQSQQILEAFISREYGPDWRDGGAGEESHTRHTGGGSRGPMTVDEAREILGVDSGATPEEIEAAYRNAIKRNHPDAGGSSWLAAKINEARSVLLG